MNISINGIKTNYIEKGEGEAILLLHGWGSNIELFKGIIENRSKAQKVYALDMPGFGKTEEPKEAWDVDGYVDFVIEFIKKMKITKLSLLGHSFGGRVIIKLVNRKDLPFEINKLVLIDSAGIKPEKVNNKNIKTYVYKLGKKVLSTKLMKKLFPNGLDKLKSKFGSADYRNATPRMRDILVKTVNEDLTDLLPTIKYSTLLIWGDKDTATPFSDAEKMNKLIKDSGIVKVEGAGHYSFLDNPILVNRVLDSFLGGAK